MSKHLHNHKSDADFVLDVAKRLSSAPVSYGLDGFDVECLADLSSRLRKEDAARKEMEAEIEDLQVMVHGAVERRDVAEAQNKFYETELVKPMREALLQARTELMSANFHYGDHENAKAHSAALRMISDIEAGRPASPELSADAALREEIERLKDLINRNWSGAYWRAVNYQQAKEVNDAIAGVPCVSDFGRLRAAAEGVISSASDTYKKRNGHVGSFEDESGEKCWIVPFDAFEDLRSAMSSTTSILEVVEHQAASPPTMDEILRDQAAVNVLRPARYEARGNVIHKLPVKVPTEGGTSIEIGFPVCTASEYVDAATLARILDECDRAAEKQATEFKEISPEVEMFNPSHGSPDTADQIAAVMLMHGTPEQQMEALAYPKPLKNLVCEHDWFDCSNSIIDAPTKSCRKCGWTSYGGGQYGVFINWPGMESTADDALVQTEKVISDSDSTLFKEATPEGGVIRLAKWPEGYVLWFHGQIVWRSWRHAGTPDTKHEAIMKCGSGVIAADHHDPELSPGSYTVDISTKGGAAIINGRPASAADDLLIACSGISDDYMTSESHHPGYVLIPTAKFEAIRSAVAAATDGPDV